MYFPSICCALLLLIAVQGSQAQQKTIQVGQEIDIPTQVKTATGECAGKPSLPGYFAIEKSNCAKYVWCDQYGNETEFNCGEGTAFNQQYLTCDYPDNFKCSESSKFYESNSGIGEETGVETPELPKTSFSCAGKPHIPGLYADIEAECKLFHYCYDDTDAVFACPENTLFNQKTLVCEWAEVVSCSDSPKHYDSNKGIGEESAEETPVKGAPAAQEPVAPIAAQESVKVQAPVVAPAPTKSIVNPVVARINAIAPLIDVRGPAAKSKQIAALRPRQIAIRKGIKA